MKKQLPLFISFFLLLGGCAGSAIREPCSIDASGQQKAMENIAEALRNDGRLEEGSYIKEPFKPSIIYNGKDHCDFIVQPWRPVQTEMIWDGTIGARVDKQTLKVTDLYRVDEK
jgi:hypothetical protein